jgi:hypothetical protein
MNTKPIEISISEWQEIAQLEEIKRWQGNLGSIPEVLAKKVYGVKFDFIGDGSGYVGDMFILQGKEIENRPKIFIKVHGKLQAAEDYGCLE